MFWLTFWPGNYIWSFSYTFGLQMRHIWTLRPGFYSEFRYESREHSGLAWGAILRKVLVLTLFPRLPCSFFQEHIPKMDSFPMLFSHPTRPPGRPSARPPVMDHRLSKWLVFQYFQVQNWIKMTGFPVFPGSKLNQNGWCSSISRSKLNQNDWFSSISRSKLNHPDWISI